MEESIQEGKSKPEAQLEFITRLAIENYLGRTLAQDFKGREKGVRLYKKLLKASEIELGVNTSEYQKKYNGAIGLN